jgi:4-amino-4-deoxy-L-arabinose transferase-like glycosyltransferase
LLFDQLGASSFHDGDEALYATVAREMAEQSSFLTPTYWGSPFLHKPPLPYWLMMVSGALVPDSPECAARFPSALSALLLLALVYASTRRLAGVPAALVATALLAVNHQFLFEHAARSASFDALLSLLMFGALLAGSRAAEGRAWSLAAVVLLGLVTLVKAPMVIFPGAAILAYHGIRERRFPTRLALRGLAGVAVIALPWHLYQLVANGNEFWNAYVLYEIVGRVGDTVRDEASPPNVHLVASWSSFLPWSPLVAVALAASVVGRPWRTGDARDTILRAIGVYAASILALFCFIPAKWPWYSIPAYPALAVVTAVFLRRWYDSRARRTLPVVLALLALVCAFFLQAHPEYEPAARQSFRWPAHESFYVWGGGARDALATVVAIVTLALALVALRPWKGRTAGLAAVASAMAVALMLSFNWRSLREVPQTYRSGASRLASEVEERNITRVFALGFAHRERYGGRMEPLSSYYLLGIHGAEVVDCGAESTCLDGFDGDPAALAVWGPGLSEPELQSAVARASALAPRLDTWVLRTALRLEKLSP